MNDKLELVTRMLAVKAAKMIYKQQNWHWRPLSALISDKDNQAELEWRIELTFKANQSCLSQ